MRSKNCARANPDMKIRAGIELDNDPETSAAGRRWVEKNWDKLDFVLGSVHYLDRADQMFDSVPAGAEQFVGRDIDRNLRRLFSSRARDGGKRPGRLPGASGPDQDSRTSAECRRSSRSSARRSISFASRGLAIELSTAGWRKPVNELYPSDAIIRAGDGEREFHSRLHPTRTHTCSWAKITIAWPRK